MTLETVTGQNFLERILEEKRFLHALSYVECAARGLKIFSTSELSQLNRMLRGCAETDVWRVAPTSVRIPSGKLHHFNILSNPMIDAREIIGSAWQIAGNQELLKAATLIYTQFVVSHLFQDANRRTAVLATYWLVLSHGGEMNAGALARFAVGDLREPEAVQDVSQILKSLIDFSKPS